MIRSPMRRHHHHRSKSPIREPRKRLHERERSPRKRSHEREREHRSTSHLKRSREDEEEEEENGRHNHHHHHHRRSREEQHVKERSHREKDSAERSRNRDRSSRDVEVSVDRRRSSASRDEHDKGRHVEEREEKRSDRSKRKHSESPRLEKMERNRNGSRPSSSVSPSRRSRSRVHNEVSSPRADEHRNENDSVAKMKAAEEALEAKKKEEPSFELSGKLAEETNRVRGVTLLFTEPPDARKPDIRWRLYVFKAGEVQNEPLYIHRQSCYLFGRERRVADVPTDHPSCSKQHAVIQFRLVERELPDGMISKQVRPYLMDLGSTNGTFLNENRIESQHYYELFEKDTIKFGNSSREYVMLHENSA